MLYYTNVMRLYHAGHSISMNFKGIEKITVSVSCSFKFVTRVYTVTFVTLVHTLHLLSTYEVKLTLTFHRKGWYERTFTEDGGFILSQLAPRP